MKILRTAWTIKFLLVLLAAFEVSGQADKPFSINESPLPQPTEPVNDFAGVLDAETVSRLNNRIKEFKARTNPPIVLAVAIVRTTGDRPIQEYSLAVARGWKIGSKLDDNPSALLFVAIDDRKYFTQVSRDLEDELPDGLVGQIQRQYLVPPFRQGNYAKGISDTIEAYIRTIEKRTSGVNQEKETEKNENIGFQSKKIPVTPFFCLAGLIIGFIFIYLLAKAQHNFERKGRGRGQGGGSGSGPSWIVLPGGDWDSGSSSSGSWSDWGSSSSSSDWGGFGGGGDFGGGGAGGDW